MELLGNGYASINLPAAKGQILRAVESGQNKSGLMIFWVHGKNQFMYHYPEDRNFRVEMRRLRKELRDPTGNVSEIVAGEPLHVNQHILYPINVKMPGHPCYPYVLLRQDQMFDHSDYTPYLFRTREKRDEFLSWLLNGH